MPQELMNEEQLVVAYLIAGVLFIRSLGGLSKQETARQGNLFGFVGMAIAMAATAFHPRVTTFAVIGACLAVGGIIGAVVARRVAMTQMPELVAILHSFVGLAAVLVGISSFLEPGAEHTGAEKAIHLVEIWVGVAVGAITFTGSVIAWAKLRGTISGRPLLLPARHLLNALVALAIVGMAVPFVQHPEGEMAMTYLLAMTGLACLLGIHLVMAIGGADMPVVVSLLNSYSGWAAAAAGFMLGNDLLIVTGALVGSSGAILSIIMCRAMNRSILNVVFGGFGTADAKRPERRRRRSGRGPGGRLRRGRRLGGGRQERDHRAGLRHGRRAGAERRLRLHEGAARQGRERALRDPPRRGAPARAT